MIDAADRVAKAIEVRLDALGISLTSLEAEIMTAKNATRLLIKLGCSLSPLDL
jgi:hypothetical protein